MKLNIFNSTTKDGIMSKEKKYFQNLTEEERKLLYENTLNRFFSLRNLDYEKAIFLTDKNNKSSSRVITYTTKKVKEKILLLKSNTSNLPIAVETTDDPIIVASVNLDVNKSICAIALGTLENINDNIIHQMIESLIKETNAAPFEMTFYIGACPTKENYILEDVSKLTNNHIWKDSLTKRKNKYYLDLRYAIFNQLISEIVDPNYIYFDKTDTTTDDNYFSNITNKPGKNLICVVYTDEKDV